MPKGPQGQKRLECDEDKGRFEAELGKLAKAKPKHSDRWRFSY
jgi:hypothetical protein